jgi:hypothetical protein
VKRGEAERRGDTFYVIKIYSTTEDLMDLGSFERSGRSWRRELSFGEL